MIFTNKHVVIAMIVAPILAILAYYAVGFFVEEKPQQAQPGQAYKLVAKPSCRYESGVCELRNDDVQISIVGKPAGQALDLVLGSKIPLEAAQIAVGRQTNGATNAPLKFTKPMTLQASGQERKQWVITVSKINHTQAAFRLVAYIQGSAYFAEFPAIFLVNTTTP